MKKFKLFLAAALLFAAATISSSLLAQAGYYATVEKEGIEYILYIKYHSTKPTISMPSIYYVYPKDILSEMPNSDGSEGLASTLGKQVTRAVLLVDANFKPKTTAWWFYGMSKLKQIEGLESLNTSEVTNMRNMFSDCSSITGIDISNFNTGKVVNMMSMFSSCKNLKAIHFGEEFNTNSVETCQTMFSGCESLTEISIERFSMSKNMKSICWMFNNCKNLKYVFYLDNTNIGNFSADAAKECFAGCTSIQGWTSNRQYRPYSDNLKSTFKSADNGGYLTKGAVSQTSTFASKSRIKLLKSISVPYGGDLDLSDAYIVQDYEYAQMSGYANLQTELKLICLDGIAHRVQGFDNKKPGVQTLKVKYNGKTFSFQVTVQDAFKEFKLSHGMTKNRYTMPITTSSIDISGMQIQRVYRSGKTENVSMAGLRPTISNLNTSKLGPQDITLNFTIDGLPFITTQNIVVLDAVKSYKAIAFPPNIFYTMPFTEADLDLNGGVIRKEMWSGTGSNLPITTLSRHSITGLNTTKEGDQTITINFLIDTVIVPFAYRINVKDALKEYKVTTAPTKTEYTMPFDANLLDLSGGEIQQVMWSGAITNWSMRDFGFTVSGLDPKKAGEQIVTVSFYKYGDRFDYEYVINVIDAVKEVSVLSEPSLKEYKLPVTLEDLNLTGGVIKKLYESDSTVEYAMDKTEFSVEDLDEIKAGENTLVLSFDLGDSNFEWKYKINVLEDAAEDSTGGDEPGSGEEGGDEGGETPGSGEGGSGDDPGTGEGGEGGEEGGDEPIVAVEAAGFGGGAAFEAWTSGGVLSVKVACGGVLEVLGVNGVLLRRMEVASGGGVSVALEKGVYILRLGGEVRKVVVE